VDAFELHAFSLSRGGTEKNLRRQVYRYPPGFVGRCIDMAAWRETGAGVAIFAHRVKTILLTLLIVVFALVCTLIVLAEATAWFGWLGVCPAHLAQLTGKRSGIRSETDKATVCYLVAFN
jgi:hypothetical protein